MKRIFGGILLLIMLSLALYFLGSDRNAAITPKDTASNPVIASETGEETNMRREFCTVESLHEEYFVLKNTQDELYHVDNAHLDGFKAGDPVLLIYVSRTALEDNRYTAEVYAVYPDDATIRIPAK